VGVLIRHCMSVVLVGDSGGNSMPVSIMRWHMVAMDLRLEVGIRGCTMERAVWCCLAHRNHVVGRPGHGGVLGSRGRLVIIRIRRAIVDIVGVHPLLVRSPLMLDHGGFSAKAEFHVSKRFI
jgi:hypothetical protein